MTMGTHDADCDYIVVGSGAGGGTVAARLADAGMHVILLEAGGDARETGAAGLPENYLVPGFHPLATEHPEMRWDFFVNHYADARQKDCGPHPDPRGIFYPRAGTLGGCTAHNAMIFVAPHDSDWNDIAKLMDDPSWHASKMRRYLRRLENCRYQRFWRVLSRLGIDPSRRGWTGWLATERAVPRQAFGDHKLMRILMRSAHRAMLALRHPWRSLRAMILGAGDPNFRLPGFGSFEGVCFTPLSTFLHRRWGTRERVLMAAAMPGNRLEIRLHALAKRIILNDENRAIGVEYLEEKHLYRADPASRSTGGTPRKVFARREVIIAGGAFNSPQLLMLSGIGPADQLAAQHIPLKVDLPGVGRNLQDRYEIGVVNRMKQPWEMLEGAKFKAGDPQYLEWEKRTGMYISNGAAVAVIRRSHAKARNPDLFVMALVGKFYGYFLGYSDVIVKNPGYLSWAILKAHTRNRAGRVTLRSPNAWDMPEINFNYFDKDDDPKETDLRAVVEGIRFARRLADSANGKDPIMAEELPGRHLDSDEELADYVSKNAWGHHACGTCAIGPSREDGGVVDSDFRVHGTHGLRVVDASIFPRIPGFFIVSAIYMIAEKAADSILANSQWNRSAGHGVQHRAATENDDGATRRAFQQEPSR